jgi:hypothetical protein
MPTNPAYTTKPVAASPYRVDGRATVGKHFGPEKYDVHGGPHVNVISGVRSNQDQWPSVSGT